MSPEKNNKEKTPDLISVKHENDQTDSDKKPPESNNVDSIHDQSRSETGDREPGTDKGNITPPNADDPFTGTILADKYDMLELIGEGGVGLVYKAKHIYMKNIVAIKVLFPHMSLVTEAVKRFQIEAEAASRLSHPNIIKVYDYGLTDKGQPYLVMDYLVGVCLSDEIYDNGPLPIERSLKIFIQACSALATAHANEVLHRDLKPSNIMLCKTEQGEENVVLVDFGMAKAFPQEGEKYEKLTKTGEIFGSPLYMSPEQCKGEATDVRSDIYSMGCLMYETLVGEPPISGKDQVDTIIKQITDAPGDLSSVDCDPALRLRLELVILKALSKNREKRQQSMNELQQEVIAIAQESQKGLFAQVSTFLTVSKLKLSNVANTGVVQKRAVALIVIGCLLVGGAASLGYLFFLAPTTDESKTITLTWQDHKAKTTEVPEESEAESMLADFFTEQGQDSSEMFSSTLASQLEKKATYLQSKGDYAGAEEKFKKVLEIRKKLDGVKSFTVAEAHINLANCYFDQGKFDIAQKSYRIAIDTIEPLYGTHTDHLSFPLSRNADILTRQGNFTNAENYYNWALTNWRKHGKENSPQYVMTLSHLADNYVQQNKTKKAEELYKQALAYWSEFEGSEKLNAALCMLQLTSIYEKEKNWRAASESYAKAIKIMEETVGENDVNTGRALEKHSDALWKDNKWLDAIRIKIRARKILSRK